MLNALWAAVDTDGRDGRLVRALRHDPVLEILEREGRLEPPEPHARRHGAVECERSEPARVERQCQSLLDERGAATP